MANYQARVKLTNLKLKKLKFVPKTKLILKQH